MHCNVLGCTTDGKAIHMVSLVDSVPDPMGRELPSDVVKLNAIFSKHLKELLSAKTEVNDAAHISIDSKGTDVRVPQGAGVNMQRLPFEGVQYIETLEEAKDALWKLIT